MATSELATGNDTSPDLTASNTAASSPSSPTTSHSLVTSPKHPSSRRHSSSLSPLNVTTASPLPPLPCELFLDIVRRLSQRECEVARLVSKAWNAVLIDEPDLWPEMRVDLSRYQESAITTWADRASVKEHKRGGGLRSLQVRLSSSLRHPYPSDGAPWELVHHEMNVLYSQVIQSATYPLPDADGNPLYVPTLRNILLDIRPATKSGVFALLTLSGIFTHVVFANVEDLTIKTNAHPLHLEGLWWALWPTRLRHMRVDCLMDSQQWHLEEAPLWQPNRPRVRYSQTLPSLETVRLENVMIRPRLFWPLTPSLTFLSLNNVTIHGFGLYQMIRNASPTIEVLELTEVYFEVDFRHVEQNWQSCCTGPNPYSDAEGENQVEWGDDELAVPDIALPRLQELYLSGEMTPPVWSSIEGFALRDGAPSFPTPHLLMPSLEKVCVQDVYIQSELSDEHEFDDALEMLGRQAPNIRDLTCGGLQMDNDSLWRSLSLMHGSITRLNLRDSMVTDWLVLRLLDLTPALEELDVQGVRDVSLQSVARLVEKSRERATLPTAPRIRKVCVDPPQWQGPECQAWDWLEYHGYLVKDEWAPDGDGPGDLRHRTMWKKQGKLDEEWKSKEDMAKQEMGALLVRQAQEQADAVARRKAQIGADDATAVDVTTGGSSGAARLSLEQRLVPIVLHLVNKSFSPSQPCDPTVDPPPKLVPIKRKSPDQHEQATR